MRKLLLTSVIVSVLFSGCSWFVPKAIKREASLVRIDIQTALTEVEALSGEEAKAKALSTLRRVNAHTINLDNYMQGRKSGEK